MAIARITITSTFDLEIDKDDYPPGLELEDCLKIDIENAEDDPVNFICFPGSKLKVTGEIIYD